MKLYCEHRISLGADDLWTLLHTPDFEAHLGRAIGLSEYRELERSEDSEAVYRKIQVTPGIHESFRTLLRRVGASGSVSYIEEQWRSKGEMEVRWEMKPSVLAERVRVAGVIRIEPVDQQSCLRILDGVVKVRLPGLGRLIEQAVVSGAVDAYGKSALAAGAFPSFPNREPAA